MLRRPSRRQNREDVDFHPALMMDASGRWLPLPSQGWQPGDFAIAYSCIELLICSLVAGILLHDGCFWNEACLIAVIVGVSDLICDLLAGMPGFTMSCSCRSWQ